MGCAGSKAGGPATNKKAGERKAKRAGDLEKPEKADTSG